MEKRRRLPRRAVRFPVRFWRRGRPQEAFQAFAANVSAGGMFITTRRPLPPRTPIDLEVERPEGKVVIPAVVVHAARVPAIYQRVLKSGMGVEFEEPRQPIVRELAKLGVPLPDSGGRRRRPR